MNSLQGGELVFAQQLIGQPFSPFLAGMAEVLARHFESMAVLYTIKVY
jgi:hypothetical protein